MIKLWHSISKKIFFPPLHGNILNIPLKNRPILLQTDTKIVQMKKPKGIDDIFRERLDGYASEVPAGLWDAIDAERNNRKRPAIWWQNRGIALAILFMLVGGASGWALLQNSTTKDNLGAFKMEWMEEQSLETQQGEAYLETSEKDELYTATSENYERDFMPSTPQPKSNNSSFDILPDTESKSPKHRSKFTIRKSIGKRGGTLKYSKKCPFGRA